jgi:hypothetical protein
MISPDRQRIGGADLTVLVGRARNPVLWCAERSQRCGAGSPLACRSWVCVRNKGASASSGSSSIGRRKYGTSLNPRIRIRRKSTVISEVESRKVEAEPGLRHFPVQRNQKSNTPATPRLWSPSFLSIFPLDQQHPTPTIILQNSFVNCHTHTSSLPRSCGHRSSPSLL